MDSRSLSSDSSLVFRLFAFSLRLIPRLTHALYGESFMCERRKRRWFAAAESQSAVTFAAVVVGLLRGIGRRRNDGVSEERATTPTPSARRSTLSIVGWWSTAAGFTVVTRHRHQLAKPPSRRIMTLYPSLAISPSQPGVLLLPRKIIYEERRREHTSSKLGDMQINRAGTTLWSLGVHRSAMMRSDRPRPPTRDDRSTRQRVACRGVGRP